jgi:hypothetical protein
MKKECEKGCRKLKSVLEDFVLSCINGPDKGEYAKEEWEGILDKAKVQLQESIEHLESVYFYLFLIL